MTLQNKKIAIMTMRFTIGFGVDLVVAEHAEYLLQRNNQLCLYVKVLDDFYQSRFKKYLGNKSLVIKQIEDSASLLKETAENDFDLIFFHTPPFFSLIPEIKGKALKVFYDYGEPPADLFPDKEERLKVREEKIRFAEQADLRFSISEFIKQDSAINDTCVNWLGNDHLINSGYDFTDLAGRFRHNNKLVNKFIVLNISRYYYGDRHYKGIDQYIKVRDFFIKNYPQIKDDVVFVIAGASGARDREWARSFGLLPVSNMSEEELVTMYLDADFYLTTSMWEGYNLGLAQALSFGLPVAASDKGAHKEFSVKLSNDPEELAKYIFTAYDLNRKQTASDWQQQIKNQTIFKWHDSVKQLEDVICQKLLLPG